MPIETRPPKSVLTLWLAIASLAAGCTGSTELEPWSLPVPAGAREIAYPTVPRAQRARPGVELEEELVIGGESAGGAEALFGRLPPRLGLGPSGRLFAVDRGNFRVLVFGPDGRHEATLSRRGQGPGELGQPVDVWIAAGVVHVFDVLNRRVARWSLAGELLESLPAPTWGGMVVPVETNDLVWRRGVRTQEGRDLIFARARPDGTEVVQYARMPWPKRVIDPPLGEIPGTEPDAWWAGTVPPSFAALRDGPVLVSPFEEYQVFAYALDGELTWALQVHHERPPLDRTEIDFHMENHRRRFPGRTERQIDWPERQYALADLKVDGHGHIWVFPYVAKGTAAAEPRPVDVYSADGERLWSGTISGRIFTIAWASYNGAMLDDGWQVADGDLLWGVARDPAGEFEVVRYRLREPF